MGIIPIRKYKIKVIYKKDFVLLLKMVVRQKLFRINNKADNRVKNSAQPFELGDESIIEV